ncbi:MAG: RhuM family protein, partial [Marinirhabdus sp.]
ASERRFYLKEEEISELNRVVSMYLDFAENMAKRKKGLKMKDWVNRLDLFLNFNEYDILKDSARISAKVAKKLAEKEYEKFRPVQDKNFKPDFDKVAGVISTTGKLPKEKNKW